MRHRIPIITIAAGTALLILSCSEAEEAPTSDATVTVTVPDR